MAGFEVNGVGAAQGANGNYEVKKQDAKEEYINSSFGQGYGAASGEGQVKTQGNHNSFLENTTYTKEDFAQLKKYGDNIAKDLNETNSRLGTQYADIERKLVRAMREIGNPDDPNYITAQSYLEDLHAITAKPKEKFNFPKGRKEANYKDAHDAVVLYEQNTKKLLDGITEDSSYVALMNVAKDIKANDNRNAAANAALTAGYGEANLKATEQEGAETRKTVKADGAKTRKAVHAEGAATRKTVRAEGAKTRDAVHIESAVTRNVVRAEGAKTRNTVRKVGTDIINEVHEESTETRETVRQVGKDTQETTTLSNKVSDNLNNYPHTSATKKAVGDIRDKITSSNLAPEEKKEMLDDLAGWSGQAYIGDKELEAKQKEVNDRLAFGEQEQPEVSKYDLPPLKEVPVYEDLYANTETKNPPKISAGYNKPIRKNPFIKGDTPKAIDNGGGTSTAPAETKESDKAGGKGVPYAPDPEPSILDKKPFWKK